MTNLNKHVLDFRYLYISINNVCLIFQRCFGLYTFEDNMHKKKKIQAYIQTCTHVLADIYLYIYVCVCVCTQIYHGSSTTWDKVLVLMGCAWWTLCLVTRCPYQTVQHYKYTHVIYDYGSNLGYGRDHTVDLKYLLVCLGGPIILEQSHVLNIPRDVQRRSHRLFEESLCYLHLLPF